MSPVHCRQGRYGAVEPGEEVTDGDGDATWPYSFNYVQRQENTDRLNDEVVGRSRRVGAVFPETRDRAPDQARVVTHQRLRVQTLAGQGAHLEVLDDNVRIGGQESYQRLTLRLREVRFDRPFAAIARKRSFNRALASRPDLIL